MKRFFGSVFSILSLACSQSVLANDSNWELLKHFASSYEDRFAGSNREHSAANWLTKQYEIRGFEVKQYPFSFYHSDRIYRSKNLEVELEGSSEKVLIIGAHYDSIGKDIGSAGFIDNASGVITLLALAKRLKNKDIPFNIRFVSFGAEELGLHGSKEYVSSIDVNNNQIIGMINLDTVFGGDNLYIHSAHSIPYKCRKKNAPNYSSSTWLRDELLLASKMLTNASSYFLHAATTEYPEGETGGWSDHAPFSCIGIPIAHIEATNFDIKGESGKDGYSQTVNNRFWSCFDSKKMTACDSSTEKLWGRIWHTKFDQERYFSSGFEEHLKLQFNSNIELIEQFVLRNSNKTHITKKP